MSWLDPVRAALDAREAPLACFVRDDDAGWADDRLVALVRAVTGAGLAIDLAVIPSELDTARAELLVLLARGGLIHLHQHGRSHANHEPEGRRKCEFGASRALDELHADVAWGWHRMREMLGDDAEPVFTPPWNRCVDALGPVLVDVGHRVLSRDDTAGRLGAPGLVEVPVTLDWFGRTAGQPWSRPELAQRIAGAVSSDAPLGLMLHHAVTDDDELTVIREVVAVLAAHPSVRPTSIARLAGVATLRT